jgi:DNA-binding response OmpR family regulator
MGLSRERDNVGVQMTPDVDVLIIEDEPLLAVLLVKMLKRMGYAAEFVLCGADGLLALDRLGAGLKLVILDYGLPDYSCSDLAPQCRSLAPNARLVVTSGLPQASLEGIAPEDIDGFLAKPFNFEKVKTAIEDVLG